MQCKTANVNYITLGFSAIMTGMTYFPTLFLSLIASNETKKASIYCFIIILFNQRKQQKHEKSNLQLAFIISSSCLVYSFILGTCCAMCKGFPSCALHVGKVQLSKQPQPAASQARKFCHNKFAYDVTVDFYRSFTCPKWDCS